MTKLELIKIVPQLFRLRGHKLYFAVGTVLSQEPCSFNKGQSHHNNFVKDMDTGRGFSVTGQNKYNFIFRMNESFDAIEYGKLFVPGPFEIDEEAQFVFYKLGIDIVYWNFSRAGHMDECYYPRIEVMRKYTLNSIIND